MKKINLIALFLLVVIVSVQSQVNTGVKSSLSDATGKTTIDKYHVAFCDYQTDTISFEQLRNCNTIKVLNEPQLEIISYSIVCLVGKSDIYEYNGTGSQLPERVIQNLLRDNITHFWIEKITVLKDNAELNIGTRKFYLKS
jgi:hypothetical protein